MAGPHRWSLLSGFAADETATPETGARGTEQEPRCVLGADRIKR
ncbi:hypothetical protein OOZ19_08820 [Saccharopolyspora sp. NFXS83]|nr:hypothetical protein [Saccharopolyspora sp. NFXS83]